MATQLASVGTWPVLPSTTDEQADILRHAMRLRGLRRRGVDRGVSIDRWEADLLIGEARKVGPVAREALVLLHARAAEWASREALRGGASDLGLYAALMDSALETWGQVRDSFHGDSQREIAALEARLVELQSKLAPATDRLAKVMPWPAGNAGATRLLDRASLALAPPRSPESCATSVMDRDAVLGAIGYDPAPPPAARQDSSATSVLDRASLLAAVGYESSPTVPDRSDASATSVMDRDAVFAAIEAEASGARGPIATVGAATSVMERDEILQSIGYDIEPPANVSVDASTLLLDRGAIVDPLAAQDAAMDFDGFDLGAAELQSLVSAPGSVEPIDDAASAVDPIALSLSIDLIGVAPTVDCEPIQDSTPRLDEAASPSPRLEAKAPPVAVVASPTPTVESRSVAASPSPAEPRGSSIKIIVMVIAAAAIAGAALFLLR